MHQETVRQIADYFKIITQVDRTLYLRCRQTKDLEALGKGLASLFPGKVHLFLHQGDSLVANQEDQLLEPLLRGETVLFLYPGETERLIRLARQWDCFQFKPGRGIEKPGLLTLVQIFDNEDPIPYEGSTRWIFKEEVESLEVVGRDQPIDINRLENL